MNVPNKTHLKNVWPYLFFCGLFAVLLHGYLSGDRILAASDPLIAHANQGGKEILPRLIGGWWSTSPLLGRGYNGGILQFASFLKVFLPPILWNNVVYALACLLASSAFYFCFKRKLGSISAVLGALVAFWLGCNFTIITAGHAFRPYIALLFICSFLSLSSFPWYLVSALWGASVGLMFVQQPDVAMFFALFAGTYFLFHLWGKDRFSTFRRLKITVFAIVIALMFALQPLLSGYKQHVKGAAQMQTQNKLAKWEYITQWSWPPEDSIDFVAPGYTGWGSGRPDGPYWGRCGRSAGWEETGQGFKNFKLDAYYLGMIAVGFALYALYSSRRSKHKAEILFWGGAALISLVLAFGKFFPLYAVFFKLPIVNNIRNPVKFLQVFQICVAILAVYGMNAWLVGKRQFAQEQDGDSIAERGSRRFFWFLTAVLGLFTLSALIQMAGRAGVEASLVGDGWLQEQAATIVANKIRALWHAALMTLILAGAFAVSGFQRTEKARTYNNSIAVLLVLVVAVDAYKLSRHYIKDMPRSYIQANALTDFIKKDLGQQRVAFLSQQGVHNIWITYLMPYNRIPCFNFTDMPRMATDYMQFLEVGQRDPLNMWRFSSVKYLLGPSQAEQQLTQMNCKKVFTYALANAGDKEFEVVPHVQGPLAVYELTGAIPRYALFAGSRKGSNEEALAGISDLSVITLSKESSLPELDGKGQVGSVNVISYRDGNIKLHVETPVPAILRCADRYNPAWKATVNGERVDVGQIDFICQGIYIPTGKHEVRMRYAPSRPFFFYIQLAGCFTLLGASIVAFRKRKNADAQD